MSHEMILMLHPVFGILAILAALWLFVEVLNLSQTNLVRVKIAAIFQVVCMWGAYLVGGYWYVQFYATDKSLIKAGPWPWAHSFIMETKEHVFFILLLLSIYLPILVFTNNILVNKDARRLMLWVAALIVLLGLGMEGAGAIVSMGAKVALMAK